ncbi:MAG: hypothetical protein DRI79_13675 [Chloroflexi bacterium]|nr:MAG: hypothetical protein DRI79_13675 [Chloroflexota bacterium]
MSEEQVREPRAPYMAAAETPVEEPLLERLRVEFPPYFDRFLEERDRRLSSELERLEEAIERNSADIARVLREMERRFAEAREEREGLRAEMERRFAEAREERKALRAEMHSQFRWIIGLLFPLVIGMLAIIIRVFILGTF